MSFREKQSKQQSLLTAFFAADNKKTQFATLIIKAYIFLDEIYCTKNNYIPLWLSLNVLSF